MRLLSIVLGSVLSMVLLNGCTAIGVTGAVVGTAVGVTSGAVKATGAVVDAVIPDDDE